MTEGCGLLSYSTALGQQLAICDCCVLLIPHLNGNSDTCDAKLPQPLNVPL
ncbi:MAG: hypothetical protein RMY36_031585 [Nostoc sp. SerVER01]